MSTIASVNETTAQTRSATSKTGTQLITLDTSGGPNPRGKRAQSSFKTGQWQVMTPAEQEGITRQATQGHMGLEIVGKTAARANVKTLVLSHLTAGRW